MFDIDSIKRLNDLIDRTEENLEKIKKYRLWQQLLNELEETGWTPLANELDILSINYIGMDINAHDRGQGILYRYKCIVLLVCGETSTIYISDIYTKNENNTIKFVKSIKLDEYCIVKLYDWINSTYRKYY